MFATCAGQMRFAGMESVPVGLDYAGVRAAMDLAGVPEAERPEIFRLVRVAESAWLEGRRLARANDAAAAADRARKR